MHTKTLDFILVQEGFTALIAAASAGHIEVVKLLLDHGAEIITADPVCPVSLFDSIF